MLDTTSTYQTTQGANKILTPGVAGLTASCKGIIVVVTVHFMQEASSSLPLMLKYCTKQPLRTNKQQTLPPVNRPTLEIFKVQNVDDAQCLYFLVLSISP